MSILILKLPDVKVKCEVRPTHCPSCKGQLLQRWGGKFARFVTHK